jgi:hypothetical protein
MKQSELALGSEYRQEVVPVRLGKYLTVSFSTVQEVPRSNQPQRTAVLCARCSYQYQQRTTTPWTLALALELNTYLLAQRP